MIASNNKYYLDIAYNYLKYQYKEPLYSISVGHDQLIIKCCRDSHPYYLQYDMLKCKYILLQLDYSSIYDNEYLTYEFKDMEDISNYLQWAYI